MDFRRFIFLFLLIFLALFFPNRVSAHSLGQPPFFKINGQYAGFYDVISTSKFFDLPQDKAPQSYLPGSFLNFEIDTAALGMPIYTIRQAKFIWDFGDGITGEGTYNIHKYTKSGAYILNIQAIYGEAEPALIESVLINILPNKDYQLPLARLSINNSLVSDPFNDSSNASFRNPINFSAEESLGPGTLKFIWDFGDGTTGSTGSVIHKYADTTQVIFPILRAIDANGFYSDTYARLYNTDINTVGPQMTLITNQTIRGIFSQILEANTKDPLLFIFVIVLVFIAGSLHALTPGHGKGVITAFLVGKKGSNLFDVLTLSLSITLTHTFVIFVLGFIFLWIDQHHTLTDVLPYFEKGAAIVVIVLGIRLMFTGYKHLKHYRVHHHDHLHRHIHSENYSKRTIILAGFSGGIVPCTDAFALLLIFASEGKTLIGIFYVLIFSVGLSLTIVILGLLLVIGKKSFSIDAKLGTFADAYLPIISGIILVIISIRLLII